MVRLAVVGTKGVGGTHLGAIRSLAEASASSVEPSGGDPPRGGECVLAALCDVDADEAARRSAEYGVPGYTKVDEMLAKEKLDGVTICTPHWFHPQIAIAAFEAGVNVLTEKPMAVAVGDAEKMTAAARKAKKALGVVFQHRTDPLNAKAREIVASGEIGELHRLALTTAWFRPEIYYRSGEWRGTWKGEGGGVLLNQAPHSLDLFIWISGMMPDRVLGLADTYLHEIEVEDRGSALLRYPNGATGYVTASTVEYPGVNRMELAGDRGRLVLEESGITVSVLDASLREFSRTTEDGGARPAVERREILAEKGDGREAGALAPQEGHGAVIADFVEAVRDGRDPMVPGEEGVKSLEIANAITLSSHRGREVAVPVPRKAYSDLIGLLVGRKPKRRKRGTAVRGKGKGRS